MNFTVHIDGEQKDETVSWVTAQRVARDISTRFGNAGERVDIVFNGIMVSYINGTQLEDITRINTAEEVVR